MAKIQLDSLDRAILTHLVEDGRKSFAEISADLNVSAGTIRNRLTRLEESGTVRIIGFVDMAQVGMHAYATIHLRISPATMIPDVVDALSQFPEVSFLASVSGDYDLHVDVQCLDNEHLVTLLQKRIQTLAGVVDTKTTMMLKVHKYGQSDLEILRLLAEEEE